MAVHFNSIGSATTPSTPQERTHAAASSARTGSPGKSKSSEPESAGGFRAVLSMPSSSAGSRSAATPAITRTPVPAQASLSTSTPAATTTPVTTTPATTATPATTSTQVAVAADPSSPSASTAINGAPTAEQVFGDNPWVTNPTGTGPGGITFGYNPLYFATPQTAATVAQMVGGTVVQDNEFTKNTPGDPFAQQQPNEMVELPGGALINPGLIASLYTHGLPQWEINQAITNEVTSAEASVTTGA